MGQTPAPINPFEIISFIAFYTELVPVLLYLVYAKKIGDKAIRVIFLLLAIGFVTDFLNNYLSILGRHTISIGNIFTLTETLFIGYFFFQIIETRLVKKIMLVCGAAFCVFWLVMFIKHGTTRNMEQAFAIEAIGIITLSVIYFFEQLLVAETTFLYLHPRFWIVTAYLIYTAGTFFLFLYFDSLGPVLQKKFYVLNSLFLILKTIFVTAGMFMKGEKSANKLQLNRLG